MNYCKQAGVQKQVKIFSNNFPVGNKWLILCNETHPSLKDGEMYKHNHQVTLPTIIMFKDKYPCTCYEIETQAGDFRLIYPFSQAYNHKNEQEMKPLYL